MAWVTEYDMGWTNRLTSAVVHGNIYLQRDGGSYQSPLLLRTETLEIRQELPTIDDQIVRANCTFTVVNDFSDFYELMPLMTISNGQIRVVVTQENDGVSGSAGGPYNIFIGFLNCEAISQDMLHKSDLRFTASGLLNKLEHNHPACADVYDSVSLFNVIDDCLALTGATYDIRVLCSLYELNNALSSGQTLFNRTALYTELMWENNVDRMNGIDTLSAVLRSFSCYIYWFQEYWYIEHYEDMGDAVLTPYQKTYVEYTAGTSAGYGYSDSGSNQVVTIGEPPDIHDPLNRPQVGGSQQLQVIPGMRQIDVRLDQKPFLNLISPNFADMTFSTDIFPIPPWREWEGYQSGSMYWTNLGLPFFNIANSVYRNGFDTGVVNGYGNGITTSFKLTVKPDTQLTVKWKWCGISEGILPGDQPLEEYVITFTYWCSVMFGGTAYFLQYNETAEEWQVNIGTVAGSLQTVDVSGSELDPQLLTTEISVTIPIGEAISAVASSSGEDDDTVVIFGIGTEEVNDGITTPQPNMWCAMGDVIGTISETQDNNLISGTQNTDFLDKKEIKLELFNSGWSYRNVLLTGPNDYFRATEWGYGSASDSIARWVLTTKFRFYNVARQKIVLDYISYELFQPLQVWLDNKQSDKTFILTGDTYKPESGKHSLVLTEYDDTTAINLI